MRHQSVDPGAGSPNPGETLRQTDQNLKEAVEQLARGDIFHHVRSFASKLSLREIVNVQNASALWRASIHGIRRGLVVCANTCADAKFCSVSRTDDRFIVAA